VAENITVHFAETNKTSTYTTGLEVAKSSVLMICSKADTVTKQALGLTSLIEAMALGKPVIMTRNKYLPQYLEDNNVGLFVNPGSIKELREAIMRISSDNEFRRQLEKNARQVALEKCNLKLLTKDLAKLFETI